MNNKVRNHRVDVRLNDYEFNILNQEEKKREVSKSKLIRTLIYFYKDAHLGKLALQSAINEARTPEKHASKLFSACSDVITQANSDNAIIAPIANNFNQLVRKVNGDKTDFSERDRKLIIKSAHAVKDCYKADRYNRSQIIKVMNEIRKEAK